MIRILGPESDDDSDDMMNELYHFEELVLNGIELEWFDPYKAIDSDGWNEMIDTEEEFESEPESEEELIPK